MSETVKVVHIYKIVCKDPTITDCYIGSTENLPCRKNNHYHNCINPDKKVHNLYCYVFIRDNGGWDNWEIIEVEKYNSIDLEDRRRRERYWLEYYGASLNKNTPYISKDETIDRNRERCKKIMKNKYTNDPIFREKEKNKRNEKYANDPIFREKRKEYSKEYYQQKNQQIAPE